MTRRIGLRLEQWPAFDQAAWARTTTAIGPFDADAPASRWRPKSRDQARYAYSRWLAFLQRYDPAALDRPPAARVTFAAVRDYVNERQARLSEMSIAAELQHFLLAIGLLAPQSDWAWLRQLQYAYRRRAGPRESRSKIIDPRRLLALGEQLMDQAATEKSPKQAARCYRDGLLIAMLAARPLRRRSLAALHLDQHVNKVADHYVLALGAADTKNGHAVEFDLPEVLTERMDTYLARYRPSFPKADASNALWLSSKGGALAADAIYLLVCRHTKAAFGEAISPHLFRDIAATAIAREAPDQFDLARELLTHADRDTTKKYYSRATTADASRRHAVLVEALRHPAASTPDAWPYRPVSA